MATALNIGIIGGGPVTQAIHLPVLAAMRGQWSVSAVMDVDRETAEAVAERAGARAVFTAEAVIEDPAIDVVAICSPNAFHAEQVIAACRAGKRAVLCEKPLAIRRADAAAIAAAAEASGTYVMVGTMHAYDPAYRQALSAWEGSGEAASHIASTIYLPPNPRFVDLATETHAPAGPPPSPAGEGPAHDRTMLRATILGLAIHDLPLVRRFMPSIGEVVSVRRVPPFGYSLLLADGDRTAELNAIMPGEWPIDWRFEASSPTAALEVRFPPSYVRAGAGRASLTTAVADTRFGGCESGYDAQWRHLHAIVADGIEPLVPLAEAVADLAFAVDLADRAVAWMEQDA